MDMTLILPKVALQMVVLGRHLARSPVPDKCRKDTGDRAQCQKAEQGQGEVQGCGELCSQDTGVWGSG